jgi:hypothetical protein
MYKLYNKTLGELGVKDSEMKGVQRGNGLSAKRTSAIIKMHDAGHGVPELSTLFNRTPLVISNLIKYQQRKKKNEI